MNHHSAVVFAYHNIGVVGLEALLRVGVDVKLVVTHQDNSDENVWFDSVAELAESRGIPVITPDDPNAKETIERLKTIAPDWLFSFYYRQMLSVDLLSIPVRGAYNLHGSLLPKYRGRAPVNWAVLHGEDETGLSLHQMVVKPDAGPLVDQEAVKILPNDTAHDVFLKLTPAAVTLLDRCLPRLLEGKIEPKPLDLEVGSYFGGRRPEDGRIDWNQSAWQIHNLVRAVAPPYPGAFFDYNNRRVFLLGSEFSDESTTISDEDSGDVKIYWERARCYAGCRDGRRLFISHISVDGKKLDFQSFKKEFQDDRLFPLVTKKAGNESSISTGT